MQTNKRHKKKSYISVLYQFFKLILSFLQGKIFLPGVSGLGTDDNIVSPKELDLLMIKEITFVSSRNEKLRLVTSIHFGITLTTSLEGHWCEDVIRLHPG